VLYVKQETAHHDLIVHSVWNKLKYHLCFPCLKKYYQVVLFLYIVSPFSFYVGWCLLCEYFAR